MQPAVAAKSLKQPENILDRQDAPAPVDELHGAAVLQVNAGNQHDGASLTVTPWEARKLFSSPMG